MRKCPVPLVIVQKKSSLPLPRLFDLPMGHKSYPLVICYIAIENDH